MSDVRRVRAAVVGTGFIGVVHAEAVRRAGGELVGILGSSPERALMKARSMGADRIYSDMDELLSDPTVDVVHITSPNYLHFPQAMQVIESGKHVICEKPLAKTSDEGLQLLRAARAAGVIHAVCFNIRFYPLMHQAHEIVNTGNIGDVRFVTGSYHQDWLMYPTDWNWRLSQEQAGDLRAVADIGSHWLDLTSWIAGVRVQEVLADLHTFVPVRERPLGEVETFRSAADIAREKVDVGNDDAAGILLRYENGARGAMTVSQVSAGRKNDLQFEVSGAEAALAWHSASPDRLWRGERAAVNHEFLRDPAHLAPRAAAISFYPGGHVEGFGETFRGLFERVYTAITGGDSSVRDYPTFEAGYEALCVTDAVKSSNATRMWQPIVREDA